MSISLRALQHLLLLLTLLMVLPVQVHSGQDTVDGEAPPGKTLAYIVSDRRIPFWDIMARGILASGKKLGYAVEVYSSENKRKNELQFTLKAIADKVDGLIISPINSSTSVTLLKLAKKAGIPVVIADIGTDGGDYVTYISSDNRQGAYDIGRILAEKLQELNRDDGSVGIVAIPQKRANGQARTRGFMQAMDEAGIRGAGIRQQVDFSYEETYRFSRQLIDANPDLRALWLQGSDRYQGALDAIRDAGKSGDILLVCFDAEPEFLEMIPKGELVGAAMQQPFLMGEQSVKALHAHLQGQAVEKQQQLPVLAISAANIADKLSLIQRNVLGMEATR